MGDTERSEQYRGPCPCGKGQFVVEKVEYSHMYGGSTTFDFEFTCAACANTYEINERENVMLLKSEAAESRKRWSIARNKEEFIEQKWVAPLRIDLEALARSHGRTKKHWYEKLKALLGPVMPAQDFSDFDTRVTQSRSFSSWMKHAISVGNIRKIAAQLGVTDTALMHDLDELDGLLKAAAAPIQKFPLPWQHGSGA